MNCRLFVKRRLRSPQPIAAANCASESSEEDRMGLKAAVPVIGASVIAFTTVFAMSVGFGVGMGGQGYARADDRDGDAGKELSRNDRLINTHARDMVGQGRQIFRFDTFGSEAFFGDALQLHKAIAGAKNGGVGPGV